MILDVIGFILISAISVFLLVLLVSQRKARIEALQKYVNSEIEKSILMEKLQEALRESELKGIEGSDGFLKFVSDSREWAFKYIEDVQDALSKFDKKISADLEYADKYGELSMDMPSKDALARISKAYKELKQILPQDMVD